MRDRAMEARLRAELSRRANTVEARPDGLERLEARFAADEVAEVELVEQWGQADESHNDSHVVGGGHRSRPQPATRRVLAIAMAAILAVIGVGLGITIFDDEGREQSPLDADDFPYPVPEVGGGALCQVGGVPPLQDITVAEGVGQAAPLLVGRDVNNGRPVPVGAGSSRPATVLVQVSADVAESISLLRSLGQLWIDDPPPVRVVLFVTGNDEAGFGTDPTEVGRVTQVARSIGAPVETTFHAGLAADCYSPSRDGNVATERPYGTPITLWTFLDGDGTVQRRISANSPSVTQVVEWLDAHATGRTIGG